MIEWVHTTGCYADSRCIYSQNPKYAQFYDIKDHCEWTVSRAGILTVDYFEVEEGIGALLVDGVDFTGLGHGLQGRAVQAGDMISFDASMMPGQGFKICLRAVHNRTSARAPRVKKTKTIGSTFLPRRSPLPVNTSTP